MWTDLDAALAGMEAARDDIMADYGDEAEIELDEKDLVVQVALECDKETARELCRVQLGYVPSELKGVLA